MNDNNYDSDNENNASKNNKDKKIDLNISDNDIFEDDESEENEENEEKQEKITIPENSNDKKNRIIIKIKDIKKLVCPECGEIPFMNIDPERFLIQCDCLNNHSKEYKLSDFIEESRKKLNEEIQCLICKKKFSPLKIKENEMYLCSCKNYICNECKNNHLENKDNKENKENNQHNLVNYTEKDYKCTCSESLDDYLFYCKSCNKNLCMQCEDNHRKKDPVLDFCDEITKYLKDDNINEKMQKYEKQKQDIKKILTIIYEIKKDLDEKISNLIKTLNSYLEINNYILKKFAKAKMNEQMIENMKKINFRLPESFKTLIQAKEKKEKYFFFINLFEYQDENENNTNITKNQNNSNVFEENNINEIKNYKIIESDNIKEEITSICQIKKGIAVGDKKGKVHIYYFKENKLIKDFIIKNKAQTEINYLYSLNNGNLISSNKYELNIYDLASRNNNTIQTFKYINLNEDHRFSDMAINDIKIIIL